MNQRNIYCSTPSQSSEEVVCKGYAEKKTSSPPKKIFNVTNCRGNQKQLNGREKNLDMPFGHGSQTEY